MSRPGDNRIPLWEKRGNNPRNLIGYLDTKTRSVFSRRGRFSSPTKETSFVTQRSVALLDYFAKMSGTPVKNDARINKAHTRRMAAILKGDADGDYTYYYG